MLHGCTIGDNSLIGMGAIMLNGAKIGQQLPGRRRRAGDRGQGVSRQLADRRLARARDPHARRQGRGDDRAAAPTSTCGAGSNTPRGSSGSGELRPRYEVRSSRCLCNSGRTRRMAPRTDFLTSSGMRLLGGTQIEGTAPMSLMTSANRSSSVHPVSVSRARLSCDSSAGLDPMDALCGRTASAPADANSAPPPVSVENADGRNHA